ncbi:hypothetical protein Cs7R123_26250 [Catellatospora sp. TT07R-123]|uniref:hypothetical protein n=1 Tax=Catellatospora sp. TT07R-123 TaxID=2733863 RepID=UPI001B1790AD|nr:hypothetical protein [Catellatospora sp. TT07R-123]GHJ45283.1 hypothetical protein Cs7R123_26250 [Catellatospora sp. TT07R-123]
MRLRHPDGQTVHVATVVSVENVKDVRGLLRRLDTAVVPQRQRLLADVLSISLRLGPILATTLASSIGLRRRLRTELASRSLEVVTLDAGAEATPADGTWRSWWLYTLDLARVLVDLMPEDSNHGSVSTTLPRFGTDQAETHREIAARLLSDLSAGLTEVAWHTGRLVRVAVEAAPQTLVSGSQDIVALLDRADPSRIGACLSPAHLMLSAESATQAVTRLRRARLSVVKVRLGRHDDPEQAELARTMLAAVLGGPHADCDHLEVDDVAELDAARDELGVVGLDGAADPPLPGIGRAAA